MQLVSGQLATCGKTQFLFTSAFSCRIRSSVGMGGGAVDASLTASYHTLQTGAGCTTEQLVLPTNQLRHIHIPFYFVTVCVWPHTMPYKQGQVAQQGSLFFTPTSWDTFIFHVTVCVWPHSMPYKQGQVAQQNGSFSQPAYGYAFMFHFITVCARRLMP